MKTSPALSNSTAKTPYDGLIHLTSDEPDKACSTVHTLQLLVEQASTIGDQLKTAIGTLLPAQM